MSLKKILFSILICLFFSSGDLYSQVDRRISNQNYGIKRKQEKVDYVELATERLKKELQLDAFQEAVIIELLKDSKVAEEKMLTEDIPQTSKLEQVTMRRVNLHNKIAEILTPEQKLKFEKMTKKKK